MRLILALLGTVMFSSTALAAGYMEKKSGDLSNDGLNPTAVKVKLGDNVIEGDDGTHAGVTDRDYFTIKIAKGQQLSAIVLDPKTVVGGNVSFIGVQKGKQVTVAPVGGNPADLLGWTHFGTDDEGTDLLPAICTGAGAQGCTPPLGPGTYSFWVQELATCDCHYRFVFTVTTQAAKLED